MRDSQAALSGLAGATSDVLSAQQATATAAGNIAAAVRDVTSQLPDVIAGIGAVKTVTGELTAVSSALVEGQRNVHAVVRQFNESIGDLNSGIPAFVAGIRDAGSVTADLGNTTRTVVTAQAQLLDAIRQLHDAGLTAALADLSTVLNRVEPVLNTLSRPFVMRPMDMIVADTKPEFAVTGGT
jgi:uncharacterized phage infection (PIP) family protein YhgE